jgi:hypothetical protein
MATRISGKRGKGLYKVIWHKHKWLDEPFSEDTNSYLAELTGLRKKLSEGKGRTAEQHEDWISRSYTVEEILGGFQGVLVNDWECKCQNYCLNK